MTCISFRSRVLVRRTARTRFIASGISVIFRIIRRGHLPNSIVVIIDHVIGLCVNQKLAMRIEKQFDKALHCDQCTCHLQIDCKLMDCHIKGMHSLDHCKKVR